MTITWRVPYIRKPHFHFLLNCRLYIEQRTVLFKKNCTITIFGMILELYYLETLKKTRFKIICYQMQCRHSLRTVGDSLKEHTPPFFFLLICCRSIFLYHKCLYTYYPSCSLSDLCMYDTGENFI